MSRSTDSSLAVPRRRAAAVLATCAALGAGAPAYAADGAGSTASAGSADRAASAPAGSGTSSAAVLRTDLDVSLLRGALRVPLDAPVNEVRAPGSAEKTALTVLLDGIVDGKPITVFRADTATARATAGPRAAVGRAHLAQARVYAPGLPALPLIEVDAVTSTATCRAGSRPAAAVDPIGAVTVLGKRVPLAVRRATKVTVPGVGEVRLSVAETATTARTAAAAALELRVAIDPLRLNVASVTGRVALAETHCTTPAGPRA
ncbi:SCO1860 family LAETG-anchored protein [Streptomyces sp. HSW2009]|uniref:SCO1860 family LAETG-anchored protein n=1 Tax=Streptomyces sp. HSW2009 TaxID=3142890 RepID=UPI0032EE319F